MVYWSCEWSVFILCLPILQFSHPLGNRKCPNRPYFRSRVTFARSELVLSSHQIVYDLPEQLVFLDQYQIPLIQSPLSLVNPSQRVSDRCYWSMFGGYLFSWVCPLGHVPPFCMTVTSDVTFTPFIYECISNEIMFRLSLNKYQFLCEGNFLYYYIAHYPVLFIIFNIWNGIRCQKKSQLIPNRLRLIEPRSLLLYQISKVFLLE